MREIIKFNLPNFAEETEAGSNCSRLWLEKIQVSIRNIQQQTRTLGAWPPVQGLLASSTRETEMGGRIHTWLMKPPESEKVFIAQSCPNLCDATDCSPPGSSVHGILQAIILEWVAISCSRGSSRPRDQTWVFYVSSTATGLPLVPPGKPFRSQKGQENRLTSRASKMGHSPITAGF